MKTKVKISAYILRGSAAGLLVSCAIVALSSAISLPNKSPKLSALENDAIPSVNAHGSAASAATSAIRKDRTLTFADRVAYQRAIEEVYWRHRSWPAANAAPKPTLDKVMSQAQIEKKVEDYLRDSQALEDYWQRPITPDQLQAEMERIASHTKQPGVLRELFAALGNDPFVIAECLARPVLAERLITELYARDQRFHGELKRRAEAELRAHRSVKQMKQTSGMYTEMEWIESEDAKDGSAPVDKKSVGAVKLNSSEWEESVGKLVAMFGKGSLVGVIDFNRSGGSGEPPLPEKGAALAQIKTGVLSPLQEDDAHYYAVAVTKKSKDRLKLATVAWLKVPLRSWLAKAEPQTPVTMASVTANYTLPVIGGPSNNRSPSGICTDDTWTPTSLTGAPAGRIDHTAVWTGSEMIVWAGRNSNLLFLNSGGRYNPSTDSWTATSTFNAPTFRYAHTAVWTGSEMIVWGGYVGSLLNATPTNTGGRYNPNTDSWIVTSTTGAPSARAYHTAVWTGSEMIVWGAYNGTNLNTGGRYNPSTDSWAATSTTNAPTGRERHTAVWTGSEMIVWGGYNGYYLNTGGRYNPSTDSWTATSTTNAPSARYRHTGVWAGSEMIVWGGYAGCCGFVNTGGRYDPSTDSWAAISTISAPPARWLHTTVWTGSEMIVWGGSPEGYLISYLNTGGRYNPNTDSWTTTSTTNAPAARYFHTAVWTGSQMIVWGGLGFGAYDLNTGGRYCATGPAPTPTPTPSPTASPTPTPTGTATATPTASPTPAPPCINDTWTATSAVNAPDARYQHTALWTGSEMIIWGGSFPTNVWHYFNTGGRYDPATDTWTPTSTINAPIARGGHTAVWTGSEMIVWGGGDNGDFLNDGGRYNPASDSWTGITTDYAPTARVQHTAIWTGNEMIVWGGYNYDQGNFNTGGRYDPSTDSWTATSTINAPEARWSHTAEWTGSEMIIWGGTNETIYLNTGGRYDPNTDSWTATSTANAPVGRYVHTAVWTGNEMIVWGGVDINLNDLNTGGRYNPTGDSWMPTSTVNAPSARDSHTAVWTGAEMVVWGGEFCPPGCPVPPVSFDTGGRYNPGTDSWLATSVANAPHARDSHTTVWIGSEMIVWGGGYWCGSNCRVFLNTGGRYCAQGGPSPTPTPTASPTPTATATATFALTPTPTSTSTATASSTTTPSTTATATPTVTARPTPTARPNVTPRTRPTPPPRP